MRKVQGNDSFQRINYLYQVSKYMAGKNSTLSSYYANLIVNVAKKHVLKIYMEYRDTYNELFHRHPDMKRQICKKCRCILVDKVSAKMQVKTKKQARFIQWTCYTCGTKRKFPAGKDKDHQVWLEKPEAVVEVIS